MTIGTLKPMAAAYVRCVIDLYRTIPDVAGYPRADDRRLAAALHDRGVDLDIVTAAFILATARRHGRDPRAAQLPPVRSLSYYLPVIEELLAQPPPQGYRDYLRRRLASSAPALIATVDHQRA
jgi:hypothetical protein